MAAHPGLSSERPRSLWHNSDFLLLWGGQVVSAVGNGISRLAFPLLVLALTASPAQAGFMTAVRGLPYLLLSLPAGALVDRWDRKRVMIVCDAGRMLALGSIPLAAVLGQITIAQLYVVSLVEGTLFVFFNLAESASVPQVIAREQLPAATVLNEATFSAQQLIGSPLGGVLFGIRQALPFLADAISYAVSLVSLLCVRARLQEDREPSPLALHAQIAEGVVWLWRQRLLRFMAFITGIGSLVFPSTTLLVIVLAQGQHITSGGIGVIVTAGGIGSVAGIALTAYLQRRFGFGQVIITTSWLYAVVWPLFALAPSAIALGAVLFALSVVDTVFNITQFGYRRALIPDALQGRVNSVFRLILFTLDTVGVAVSGVLLQRFGPVPTILLFGIFLVIAAVAASLNTHVRSAPPLTATEVK